MCDYVVVIIVKVFKIYILNNVKIKKKIRINCLSEGMISRDDKILKLKFIGSGIYRKGNYERKI
jgi:hypothetical protein